jgi:hypothetical protein
MKTGAVKRRSSLVRISRAFTAAMRLPSIATPKARQPRYSDRLLKQVLPEAPAACGARPAFFRLARQVAWPLRPW